MTNLLYKKNIARRQLIEKLLVTREFSFDELKQTLEYRLDESVSIRTLREDLKDLRESGVEIEDLRKGKKSFYRIKNQDSCTHTLLGKDEGVNTLLLEALKILGSMHDSEYYPQIQAIVEKIKQSAETDEHTSKFQPIILYDHNLDYTGYEFIKPLYEAIEAKQVLRILYQSFDKEDAEAIIFHPYYLKEYENRWFLVGRAEDWKRQNAVLPLDRMKGLEVVVEAKRKLLDVHWFEKFEDIIGITIPDRAQGPETIKFWVRLHRSNYVATKPLHQTQKMAESTLNGVEGREFTIKVIPNNELIAKLQSFGEDLVVTLPVGGIADLKARVRELMG